MVSKTVSETMKELLRELLKLWNVWDVEGCITCSLMLQVFLVLVASRRKRNSKNLKFISPFIWLAYLVADGAAIFSLGLLSDRIGGNGKSKRYYKDLLAFWAPFLLLHLGGPDTITAFALEDNELWLRNMLKVVVQLITTAYILSRSFPNNQLLIPTLLMFAVGTVRYAERIWALFLASDSGFKSLIPKMPDSGINYLKLIHEHTLNKEAGIPTSIEIPSTLNEEAGIPTSIEIPSERSREDYKVEKVKTAYKFFTTFKRIIADLLLGFNEVNESREHLLNHDPNHAFKLMDIELEFAYDILYTKAAVVHTRTGYITRAICFSSILISLLYFFFFFDKRHTIHKADIDLTYGLLCGALALELISLIRLILSNWTFVYLYDHHFFKPIILKFSRSMSLQKYPSLKPIIRRFAGKRRRSMIISQYNLINYCLFNHKYLKWLEKSSLRTLIYKFLDIFKHTEYNIVSHELKEFIFEELKKRTDEAKTVEHAKSLCSTRGRWALQNRGCYDELKWTVDVEFEESILLWHIVTDLCLKHDDDDDDQKSDDKHDDVDQKSDDKDGEIAISVLVSKRRHVSKLLSEYLLYLLIRHPKMISAIEGMRQIKYQDAYQEVISVFKSEDIKKKREPGDKGLSDEVRTELLSLSKNMLGKSKLVLFDACFLVQKLNEMGVTMKWMIISEVLAELLSFAACQCTGSDHAQALSRGGELVTHVWFLMAHLGLGQIFHVASSHAKAKVTVQK